MSYRSVCSRARHICVQGVDCMRRGSRGHATFCFPEQPPVTPTWGASTLCNGVRVVSETIGSPVAYVTLLVESGSRYETHCNNGATHFFEHLAYKSLNGISQAAFEDGIKFDGANLDIHTDREYQTFTANCHGHSVYKVINSFAKMLCDSVFYEPVISCVKQDIHTEMHNVEDDLKQLTFDYLHQTAYQGTALANPVIGPWRNYYAFDSKFIGAFVNQQYQPFRMLLAVSSCHYHEQVVRWAACSFGCIKQTTNDLLDRPNRFTGSIVRFRHDDLPYLHFAIAVECDGARSANFRTLQVMKHLFGKWNSSQWQGYATWPALAQGVTEFCDFYECFHIAHSDTGLFGIYGAMPKHCEFEDVLYQIQDKIMGVCVTPHTGDLERAKNSYKTELAKERAGCMNSSHTLAMSIFHYGKVFNLHELNQEIDSIKLADIKAVANNIFYDRCPVVAAVGPTESVPEYNRIRNGMYWLRI